MAMATILEQKKLNQNTRALIGKDAGPSNNAHENAFLKRIIDYRCEAEAKYHHAIYALTLHKRSVARERIDEALQAASNAFWFAEDTQHEESQHEMLHQLAKWKHDNLGCYLTRSGNDYVQTCSIALTHKRLGFSMGFTSDPVCTICHKDEFECEHARNRTYWVVGGQDETGTCKICSTRQCTDHTSDYIYRVCPGVRLTNPVLHEVSMVRKPAIPTARLTSIPISRKELEYEIGVIDEAKGMVYMCHTCSGGCPGFTEFKIP